MAKRKTAATVETRDSLGGGIGPAIASVIHSRIPIFAPSRRCAQNTTKWEGTTAWGKAMVEGRLTQTHRSILDALFACPIRKMRQEDGSMRLLVDPYQVAKLAGVSRDRKWLRDRILDMRDAKVTIIGDNYIRDSVIIADARWSNVMVPGPGGVISEERSLLAVTVSGAWMQIFDESMAVRYGRLLPKISDFKSGATQALVRFLFTHREIRIGFIQALEVIQAIRPEMKDRSRRDVISEVRKDAASLARLGINIRDDVIEYRQHSDIRFSDPVEA